MSATEGVVLSFPLPAGPSGPILDTDYVNHERSPIDQRKDWPKRLVGGKTFLTPGAHKYDWVPVHDPGSQYGEVYRTVIFASILAGPAAPIILDRGIKSTKYERP
jgi:hypothetical protein